MNTVFRLFLGLFMLRFAGNMFGEDIDSSECKEPLFVIHSFPNEIKNGVIVWNCPVWVAYECGLVRWRMDWAASTDAFRQVKIGGRVGDAAAYLDDLRALLRKHAGSVFILSTSVHAEVTIVSGTEGHIKIVGNWRDMEDVNGDYFKSREYEIVREFYKDGGILPKTVASILWKLKRFDPQGAQGWMPESMVVRFFEAGSALSGSVAFPNDLMRQMSTPQSSDVRLEGVFNILEFDRIRSILQHDGKPRAVLVDGKRMFGLVSFRFPFVSEWSSEAPTDSQVQKGSR